ncbi:hypothetical protein H8R01_15560 [Vibrio metschnikovii]|uniref:hypothetical protein n=1 Tax=Vibrio metschnikovii TaxID=28172 RepID=UPI0016469E29|nr:hypothetical protein [Vibrio metschnikovii]MBC3618690.1 hypothetical protein [Vibrio metschnikovii]MBC5814717.1 hypothetical protein [Vibrio metschnikovii]
MSKLLKIAFLYFYLLSFSSPLIAEEQRIESYRSAFHVGQTVMVCGVVANVFKGNRATYFNLDKPFPNQTLNIVIWDNKLDGFERRFGNLSKFNDKRVCARGKITEYKNNLQMQVSNPQFLRLMH